ncbi:MAG: magnesium-translocating P-type ATPase [Myxococcaceae bacterium]
MSPPPNGTLPPHPVPGTEGGAAATEARPLWTLPLPELLEHLGTSTRGLSAEEVAARLEDSGPNEAAPPLQGRLLPALALFVGNPLVLVLLAASVVAAVLGQLFDAIIIVSMVLLGGTLNFVQTFRSHRAVERLRQQLAPTATALRDGVWQEVPRRQIVPGDLVRLSAGDAVPADARLLEAHDLHAQQAALTGESLPSEKEAAEPTSTVLLEEKSVVLSGTSIVSGGATAVVFATGRATVFGALAGSLATRTPETEFERGTRRFGLLIMRTVVLLILFVFTAAAGLNRPALESLLFALALAVGLTPEFLPMIITVTLSRGAVHMAREKVIVKNLSAIQNLGSIDILCSDKTGTLTSGRMALTRTLDAGGQPGEHTFLLGYLSSLHETGVHSPLDQAVLEAAEGRARQGTLDEPARSSRKLDELPFDFERRSMSVAVEYRGERLLVCKGAPENVLPRCTSQERSGVVQPLDDDGRERAARVFRALSADGYRVLGVAWRSLPVEPAYRLEHERGLCFAGFLAFFDPPLEGVREALAALARDGVRVIILTGDNELVAQHVCEQVGLAHDPMVLGAELDRISAGALARVAERTPLFARVSPSQKHRVLLALKGAGHVVGYLGDGINDAPSLHAADVGISVSGAVDVARDAAEVILVERSLAVLHSGIVQGRRAFGNVIKYVLMGTSSNFGNMFSMAGAFVFLPFLPMLPTQILLNNFLYDLAQVTIPTDRVDATFVRKPHRWDISLVRDFMLLIGPLSSVYDLLTFWVLLRLFHASPAEFHTGWFVESLATQTLVIYVIRTAGNPLKSRPSTPLLLTTLAVVATGVLLPFTPLAAELGFTPLPASYFAFLALASLTYLGLVALVRGRLLRRALA